VTANPQPPIASEPTEVERRTQLAQRYFARENYEGALAEYTRVYEIFAAVGDARRFDAIYEQGRCLQRLNRFDLAIERYDRYLREAGSSASNADAVRQVVELLRRQLGTLTVQSTVRGAHLWINGEDRGPTPVTITLPGGEIEVEVRAPDHLPTRGRAMVVTQQTTTLTIRPQAIRTRRGISPAYFVIGASSTGAAFVSTAVVGTLYAVMRGRLQTLATSAQMDASVLPPMAQQCMPNMTRSDCYEPRPAMGILLDEQQSTARLATIANALAITSGVFAVATTVLGVLTDFRGGGRLQPTVALGIWPAQQSAVLSVGGAL
jgi:hypothetical protein